MFLLTRPATEDNELRVYHTRHSTLALEGLRTRLEDLDQNGDFHVETVVERAPSESVATRPCLLVQWNRAAIGSRLPLRWQMPEDLIRAAAPDEEGVVEAVPADLTVTEALMAAVEHARVAASEDPRNAEAVQGIAAVSQAWSAIAAVLASATPLQVIPDYDRPF